MYESQGKTIEIRQDKQLSIDHNIATKTEQDEPLNKNRRDILCLFSKMETTIKLEVFTGY